MNTRVLGLIIALAAVNWGLVGLFNVNVVETLLGVNSMLTRIVYILVGLAGLYKVYLMVGKKS